MQLPGELKKYGIIQKNKEKEIALDMRQSLRQMVAVKQNAAISFYIFR